MKITQILLLFLIVISPGCTRTNYTGNSKIGNEIMPAPSAKPDTSQKYLFYLHGKIVEGSDGHPVSPDFGEYQYGKITHEFSKRGFSVISEIREKNSDIEKYADRVIAQVMFLLNKNVPAQNIIVVGASKGGMIAAHVSSGIKNKHIKYVFLAGLFKDHYESKNIRLNGEILSIYDKSDKFKISPELFFSSKGISRSKSIVTETGLGHGLIYKPNSVWLDEVLKWSEKRKEAE